MPASEVSKNTRRLLKSLRSLMNVMVKYFLFITISQISQILILFNNEFLPVSYLRTFLRYEEHRACRQG